MLRVRWRRSRTTEPVDSGSCACGEPLDPVDMDYGFSLPDVLFAMPEDERRRRCRGRSRLVHVEGHGGFVRVVLPVRLDEGSVQIGLWLQLSGEDTERADTVWDEPEYAGLRLTGTVANDCPPWGARLLGAVATAEAVSVDELPRVTGGDAVTRSLLEEVWSRAELLDALPALRHPAH